MLHSGGLSLPVICFLLLIVSYSSAEFVHNGSPAGISNETDCAIRELAWVYGKQLMPARGSFKTLYDALQLDACPSLSGTRPEVLDEWVPLSDPLPQDHSVLLVAASDASPGHAAREDHYTSIADAVAASRKVRHHPACNHR